MKHTNPRRSRSHVTSSAKKSEVSKAQSLRNYVSTLPHYLERLIHLLNTHRKLSKIIFSIMGFVLLLSIVSAYFGDHVAPNVWVLDIPVGGLSYPDATNFAMDSWRNEIKITVSTDKQSWLASALDLGIHFDSEQTIQSAQGIGFKGIPFGYELQAILNFDELQAHNYFLTLQNDVNIAARNGYFVWQDNQVVPALGVSGQILDVEQAVRNLASTMNQVTKTAQFELPLTTLTPEMYDSQIYLNLAERFVSTPFQIVGYDAFTDTYDYWTTTPEQLVTWIEASNEQLIVRPDNLGAFINAINQQLSDSDQYIELEEVTDAINGALKQEQMTALVRIRHYPTNYDVVAGDTAYGISRKTGIPFFLIEEANPRVNLELLSPGDVLKLPSRDVTLPLEPVPNKRIIVDLETQSLVAYEQGQEMFRWQISSGISTAPTSPGIYQILSHEPVAYGSSYTLCGDTGCGQWELNWFMGLYEVVPGLVNGFHGAVLLPNGRYLGGNQVGTPYTLGCIMSRDDQARLLYEWADDGTIVEVISDEFAPQSQLAIRFAMSG